MAELIKLSQGKNFIVYRNGSDGPKLIKIEGVRFSYPHFGEVREDEDDSGNVKRSWGGVAMLPKSTHAAAKQAFDAILDELQVANKVRIPTEYRCLKNGDEKDDEAMHGHWLISFANQGKRRPAARDKTGGVIESAEEIDEVFYGGCWGHVLLRPWYFNGQARGSKKPLPKRLSCGYEGVQFVRDDEPFGNGRIDDTSVWGSADNSGGDGLDNDDGL